MQRLVRILKAGLFSAAVQLTLDICKSIVLNFQITHIKEF